MGWGGFVRLCVEESQEWIVGSAFYVTIFDDGVLDREFICRFMELTLIFTRIAIVWHW